LDIDVRFEGIEEALKMTAKFVSAEERALQDALEYILRAMMNYAKQYGPYTDRTSNLRNSISVNMDTMREWPEDTPSETLKALVPQNETPVIRIEGDDFVGCLSVGMCYGVFVETKGYWVITGSIDWMEPMIERYFAGKLAVEKLDLEQAASAAYIRYYERKGAR
jgi:hypothetical protein